jgi:hypothetical protein
MVIPTVVRGTFNFQPVPLVLVIFNRTSRSSLRVCQGDPPMSPCSIGLSDSQSCSSRQDGVLQIEIVVLAPKVLITLAETEIARLATDLVGEEVA